jgi:hypothetical protein
VMNCLLSKRETLSSNYINTKQTKQNPADWVVLTTEIYFVTVQGQGALRWVSSKASLPGLQTAAPLLELLYCCAGCAYIVAFTKVLTMCQLYHTVAPSQLSSHIVHTQSSGSFPLLVRVLVLLD